MTRLTYGSLFTGVGGMDMGFDTHMDCVFQVEWDKHCQSILRRHWPDVPKWADVCDVDGALLPPCDILTFGSPCQDLSVAGKRNGLDGERSSMFYQATRIIKEMRNATASRSTGPLPRAVVWENVPGALSSNNGHDFRAVIDTLEDIGSHLTEWAVLDAQHYGVPQRRRRIFLIAILDPTIASRCPDPLLPLINGGRGDYTKSRKKEQTAAETTATGVADLSAETDFDRPVAYSIREDAKSGTFSATETDTALCLNGLIPSPQSHHAQLFIAEPIIFENSYRDGARINNGISPTLPAKMGMGGGNQPHVAQPTATADYIVRRLSPLECERLMGWPDDHTRYTDTGKEQADTHRYKQCGNGVATPVARWVAHHLNQLITGDHT